MSPTVRPRTPSECRSHGTHSAHVRWIRNVTTSRDESFGPEHAEAQFKAILDRVLRAYHRDEGHGGANWIGESVLDAELVPVAREAFLAADDMPPDHEVLQVLDGEGMHLLGEGYHVMALAEPTKRFVVKYAKNREGIPPLAPAQEQPRARGMGARSRRPAGRLPSPHDLAAHPFT